MPRGGRRAGKVGKPYPNRTDMNSAAAAQLKGQGYGMKKEQQAVAASGSGPPSPPPGAPPAAPGPPVAAGPAPGGLGAFNRPTERPNEPITSGLSSGPGAGPEALGMGQGPDADDLDLRQMAVYLPALELLASQPTASMASKQFVRRLRGAMPVKGQEMA